MKKFLLFFFLTTCSVPQSNINSNNYDFDFNKETSFKNFMNELKIYSEKSPYPNIDSNLWKKILI